MNALMHRLALNATAAVLALMMIHIALLMIALGIYFALEAEFGRPLAFVFAGLIFLMIAALGALLLRDRARKPQVPATTTTTSSLMHGLTDDFEGLVRRHPLGSLGVCFAVGILVARNPAMLGRFVRGLAGFGWL